MSDDENQHIPMAECGACRAIIPLDSESCSNCNARFGGVSEETLGECGACGELQPADSSKCISCGVSFIEETAVVEEETVNEKVDAIEDETVEKLSEEESMVDYDEDDVTEELEEETSETEIEEITENEESLEEEVLEHSDEVLEESQIDEALDVEESLEEDIVEHSDEVLEEPQVDEVPDVEEDVVEHFEEDSTIDTEDIENFEDDLLDYTLQEDAQDSDEEVAEEEVAEEEIPEDEDKANLDYWRSTVVTAFENLALAIAESGMSASEAFMAVDDNEDNLIDAPELQKGIEKISGEWLTSNQVLAILEYLDTNENNRVDPMELVKALEDLQIGIKPGKMPKSRKEKVFPSNVQKMIMGKTANDVIYPIAYFLMVTFIGLWVVNSMGLIVDGSGGTIIHEGPSENWSHCDTEIGDTLEDCSGFVSDGEKYPCFSEIDANGCKNSLTIFSGDDGASSMPSGLYLDGIIMMTIGFLGLVGTAFLHLFYAPSLRNRVKKDSVGETSSETEDDSIDENDSEEVEEQDSEDDEEEQDSESDEEEHSQEDDLEGGNQDDSEDDEVEESDDDDIDIGDWVGLEIKGEEIFGEIIEFDDDEGTVTIETEDGDEVTGDQDDMFLEDDEDDDE